MKLFQQMLVAGATLGLLSPVAAQASDVINLDEMNSYARSNSKKSSRLDSKTFVKCNLENMLDLSDFIHYNSKNNYDKKNYDMLDAVVASLYHWYSLK